MCRGTRGHEPPLPLSPSTWTAADVYALLGLQAKESWTLLLPSKVTIKMIDYGRLGWCNG